MGAPRERTQPEPRAAGTSGAGSPDRDRQTSLRVAAIARRLARQACQGAGDATAAMEFPLHIRLVELVDPPFSKQGTEAALRSLPPDTSDAQAVDTVRRIVEARQRDGQLRKSSLNRSEVELVIRAFVQVWRRMRHRRIPYPIPALR